MISVAQHKFDPGARAIIQMGEELIGHPTTAINELVKNGYDADATNARVYLHYNKDNEKSFIVISDDGLGMSEMTLFTDWLQPSVSKKRGGPGKSKILQRNFLGSKGIGRLASMALGQYLTVITKTAEENEYNWLSIDRNNFKEEKLLSQVSFPGGKTKNVLEIFKEEIVLKGKTNIFNNELENYLAKFKLTNFREGTVIIVERLDDSIKTIVEDEFVNGEIFLENMSLVRALRILITPLLLNQKIQDELLQKKLLEKRQEISLPESVFEIYFGSNLLNRNEYSDSFIKIEEFEILANYDYRILGRVRDNGSVEAIYTCNRLIEDTFEINFSLSREQVFSEESFRRRRIEEIINQRQRESKVGEFLFDMRVYDRDPDAMERLSKLMKTRNRRETALVLDEFVGLRISKNGFGIKPYGEEEKDWMGLGEMRVQDPTAVLGVNQLIGNIFLYSPQNDSLSEKTNREGFFENEAFISFKKILRSILKDAGQRRFNYRQKHGLGRKADSKNNRPDVSRFINFIKTITKDQSAIDTAQSYLDEISTALDNLENSLTFSQRLATLGSGLELVYHELAQPIAIIGGSLFQLKFPIAHISNMEIRDEILSETRQIRTSIDTLDKLKESLEPAIGKAKQKKFKPVETFNKVCYLFTKDLIEEKIEVIVDDNLKDYAITDFEYHLWISFLNILNNAVFWLKSEKNENREIRFQMRKDGELVIINNGPKIENGELENIFNYGVSHKKIKNATGLGLSFTRSLLSTNGWEIWAENEDFGPAFILKKKNK